MGGRRQTRALVLAVSALLALVPATRAEERRSFVLASTGNGIPQSYLDKRGDLVGIEPELIAQISRRLGLSYTVEINTSFSGLVAGARSHRYDVVAAALADSQQREKIFDFLDYVNTWYVVITKTGNPGRLVSADRLCGRAVSATDATRPLELLQARSAQCVAGGKPAIDIHVHTQSASAIAELISGRVLGHVISGPRAQAMLTEMPGKIMILAGPPLSREPQGIAFPKGSPLVRPFQQQLTAMMKDGSYLAVMRKYGLERVALGPPAQINATVGNVIRR